MEKKSSIEGCRCIMEEETQRIKSLAFHPCKKIIMAGLHSGKIQAWNYLYKTKVFELDEHEGPVRVVVFHHLIERFASGGDDCLIRIWDYKNRSVETVFKGHTDYIRSLEFHKSLPWILSTSDDQTIRIWNFHSKKLLATLTGHTHYVMCARFINDSLFASVSLDQTIRVWDYSALTTKSQSTVMDMLGVPEVIVKHILDGHDRGINWIASKAGTNTFATGGDDSTIRIWDAGNDSVFETDTLQGHHSHVSSLYFMKQDLLISNSEDGSMKIWDTRRRKCLKTITHSSRFWCVAMDLEENVFAAGHDTGFAVYSLEKSAPVYALDRSTLYLRKGSSVVQVDMDAGTEVKVGEAPKGLKEMCAWKDKGRECLVLNCEGTYTVRGKDTFKGAGHAVVQGEMLLVSTGTELVKRSLDGQDVQSVQTGIDRAFTTEETGTVLGCKGSVLFRLNEELEKEESVLLLSPPLKVCAGKDFYVAVTEKTLVFLDKALTQLAVVEEVVSISSAVVKDDTVFYTTPMHVKFAFKSGEHSVLISTEEPFWVVDVDTEKDKVLGVCRDEKLTEMEVDMIEWRFKHALESKDADTVQACIESNSLIGEASLSYLIRKESYGEAMEYVDDAEILVELCLRTKNFEKAYVHGVSLNSKEVLNRIGEEAVSYSPEISEKCFAQTGNFLSLLLLYISTKQTERIEKLLYSCTDASLCAVAAIVTGNHEKLNSLIQGRNGTSEPAVVTAVSEDGAEKKTANASTSTGKAELPLSEKLENLSILKSSSTPNNTHTNTNTTNTSTNTNSVSINTHTPTNSSLPSVNSAPGKVNLEKLAEEMKAHINDGRASSEIDLEEGVEDALEYMTQGKFAAATAKFEESLYIAIERREEKGSVERDGLDRVVETCSVYLQGLCAEKIRKRADTQDRTALSCALFFASLGIKPEHKVRAMKSAISLCYKKGNKHTAVELSKQFMSQFGDVDARISTLAESRKAAEDTVQIDTSLPFCVDVGEYCKEGIQCGVCSAWNTSKCSTCACCLVSDIQ
ncbi:coatomer subunit alpha [Nematocida sp. AWRm77]|nr:coatomer subunit alpha [Nematocida sp. AWRm77]